MKLENVPKKQIFTIPDGYFDSLPQQIQARISTQKPETKKSFVFQYRLQYVIPAAILLLVAGIAWFTRSPDANNAESILAAVETQDMLVFLADSELTTEDLLENVDFSSDEADEIETEVYDLHLGDEPLDEMLEDLELENTDL